MFAPDLSGHREAPLSADFDAEVERLWRAIDRQWSSGVAVYLVGYSLGARVALQMLRQCCERVAGALLIGVHPGLMTAAEANARREADARWIGLLEEEGLQAFERAWQALPLFATQDQLPPEVLQRQAEIRASHTAIGLAHSLRTLGLAEMPECWALLRRPPVPLCLMVGDLDLKFSRLAADVAQPRDEAGRHQAKMLTLRRVPAVGHNVLLEAPGEVVEAVRELLRMPCAAKVAAP